MGRIEELSLEQLHYDLVELKSELKAKLSLLPGSLAEAVEKRGELSHLDVTVTNPTKEFDGKVVVENELTIKNLGVLADKLDAVIKSVEASKTESVTVANELQVKDIAELRILLADLLNKDTTVNVEAPNVKVTVPDEVSVKNWPKNPKDPLAVRLADGDRFINQLQRVVSGGGGSAIPLNLISVDSIRTTETAYATKITTVGSVTYIARAQPGTDQADAAWQVQRIDETDGTVVTWADGDAEFDNTATDLTTLTYA